jgi:hypothetical protein
MTMRILWCGMLLCVVLAACGRPPASAPAPVAAAILPRDMAGCYALNDSAGQPISWSLTFVPPMVRLYPSSATSQLALVAGNSAWAMLRLDSAGYPLDGVGSQPMVYWTAHPAADSVRLLMSTGYIGAELIIPAQARGDTLRGRMLRHWGAAPPADAGTVAVVRTRCLSASEDRRFPRFSVP